MIWQGGWSTQGHRPPKLPEPYQTKTGPLKAAQLALVPSTALPVKGSSVDLPADHSPASALPDGFALFDDGIYELPVDETIEPIFI